MRRGRTPGPSRAWKRRLRASWALSLGLLIATASASPAPRASAQQTAPPPPGAQLFADNFDDPRTGRLAKTEVSGFSAGYADGEYVIRKLQTASSASRAPLIPGSYGDATIRVDARLVGDPANGYVAVSCRRQPGDGTSLYRLYVRPDRGQFALYRYDDGTAVRLVPYRASPAVNAGNDTNRLELSCEGASITARINGMEVASVEDGTYSEGRIQILLGAFSATATPEGRFGNLVVFRPEATARIAALRDAAGAAMASGDTARLGLVLDNLAAEHTRLATQPFPPAVRGYNASMGEWALLLFYGAQQQIVVQSRERADLAIGNGDFGALQASMSQLEAGRTRLRSIGPPVKFAAYQHQMALWLDVNIVVGRGILSAPTTSLNEAQTVWGIVPILPALTDIPIGAGLLPVPQEFQVAGAEPRRAYYNVPSGGLWDAAARSGLSCSSYPSPYGGTRIVRYSGGCLNAGAPGEASQLTSDLPGETPPPVQAPGEGPPLFGLGAAPTTGGEFGRPPAGPRPDGAQRRFDPGTCEGLTAAEIRPMLERAKRLLATLEGDLGYVDLPIDLEGHTRRYAVEEVGATADRENQLRSQIDTGEACLAGLEGRPLPDGWEAGPERQYAAAPELPSASVEPPSLAPQPVAPPPARPAPQPAPQPTATVVQQANRTCTSLDATVEDVNFPSNSSVGPGQSFTKTWRLKNIGACAWGNSLTVNFTGGDNLGATGRYVVPPTAAGSSFDFSLPLRAPSSSGYYEADFQLKNESGTYFGSYLTVSIYVSASNAAPTVPVVSAPATPTTTAPIPSPTNPTTGSTSDWAGTWTGPFTRSGVDKTNGCPFSYDSFLTLSLSQNGSSVTGSAAWRGTITTSLPCRTTGSYDHNYSFQGNVSASGISAPSGSFSITLTRVSTTSATGTFTLNSIPTSFTVTRG